MNNPTKIIKYLNRVHVDIDFDTMMSKKDGDYFLKRIDKWVLNNSDEIDLKQLQHILSLIFEIYTSLQLPESRIIPL